MIGLGTKIRRRSNQTNVTGDAMNPKLESTCGSDASSEYAGYVAYPVTLNQTE